MSAKTSPHPSDASRSHDRVYRVVALLLAVVAWYAIQQAISFEATISDVPLRVLVDPGWAVLEQSASSVDVHFRGSRENIRYLHQEQLEVVVDARGAAYDQTLVLPLTIREVRAPTGARPVFVRPSEVQLSVDQEVDRQVPVRVHVQGNPPEGYEIERYTATPERVTVSGPRQRLDAIEAIRTTPIDMEGRLQSFQLRVGLVSPSRAWTARINPERVEVDITLTERSATAVFDDIRIKMLTPPGLARLVSIEPEHVRIRLAGRSELLDVLTNRDIQAYVDLSDLGVGENNQVPLRVHLPPRIRVEEMEPATVNVRIEERNDRHDQNDTAR